MSRVGRGVRRRLLRWTRSARSLDRAGYAGLVDYHIHTRLCGHAVGEPEDYVREAIALGLPEIGFADHMPLLRIRDDRLTMAPDDLPGYVEMIRELRSSVDDLKIRLGIEMDYFPGQMEEVWEKAAEFDFDYVHGSVHYIDGWGFSDSRHLSSYQGKDPDATYARYFELFCEAATEGGFDVMAHPDLVKKHGISTTLPMERLFEEAADALKSADVAVEVNTSGLRKPALDIYPSLPFLTVCRERGVAVTLGSDAHAPRQVGMDFDLARRLLRRAGVTEIATFESRKRSMRSL
ncbi:MAG: histidinol-phosphatase HisJ family protein [Candidatus Eisenbacteria bacterium]